MKETAQQIARTGTGAQVKAKGAAEQFAAALEEKRRAEALNAANQLMQQDARMDMIDEMRAQMDIEEAGALLREGGEEKQSRALQEDKVRDAAYEATRGIASAIKGL
jgi:nitrogen fixation protein FixH